MSLYDKRDDFPFAIHNYPHLDSNVPCMPTYGVYISQLIRFAKACDTYPDFLTRHQRLVATLMRQGFKYDLLCRKFKQFYRSHFDLISRYSKSVTQHLRKGVDTVIAQIFIRDLISYISYFWRKVRTLVAYENPTRIQVYLTPPSPYENF